MGTRNLILVYHNGEYKIAKYCQWDGYPEGQGFKILKFFSDPENLPKLIAGLDKLYTPDDLELQAVDDLMQQVSEAARQKQFTPEAEAMSQEDRNILFRDASQPGLRVCPSLARDTGAEILSLVANAATGLPIQNELEFIADTLFCEWAYVVDLDQGKLEVYCGHSEWQLESDRFKQFERSPAMVGSWELEALPDEATFCKEIKDLMNQSSAKDDEKEGKDEKAAVEVD
ncbi:hypothetical protein KVT40_006533 [Elsinoe batatas]|uniref:Uncharacterized protein n=1 Tax=Elsinoe batatas TaxID=2601811 RepID=A0A8K0PF14_9PEZI|nr:hypothetical protein KVT40_006533 [Elsinoe batatas]